MKDQYNLIRDDKCSLIYIGITAMDIKIAQMKSNGLSPFDPLRLRYDQFSVDGRAVHPATSIASNVNKSGSPKDLGTVLESLIPKVHW